VKVLVTGAAGQLGGVIPSALPPDARVTAVSRAALDVADASAVDSWFDRERPDVVINCAAFTDVDGSEDRPIEALTVNAFAPRALARACRRTGATLVHYGTDFVFDGRGDRPYTEDDEPSPQSVYAASKLLGEWFAADAPACYVLRVESLFGGPNRRSSIDKLAAAVMKGEPAKVFVDRTVTPSYVHDVAAATVALLERRAPPGVYHCVNTGVTTWYEVGQEIARLLGREGHLVPVRVADVKLKARSPTFAALSNDKLRRAGIDMPTWTDALHRYLNSV
jgi:dTDP-4-dehydrorhamnose reductase